MTELITSSGDFTACSGTQPRSILRVFDGHNADNIRRAHTLALACLESMCELDALPVGSWPKLATDFDYTHGRSDRSQSLRNAIWQPFRLTARE